MSERSSQYLTEGYQPRGTDTVPEAVPDLVSAVQPRARVVRLHPWFCPDGRQHCLELEAARWEGTPFFPNSRARGPGGGVDCVNLCHEIFVAIGALPRRSLPRVKMDYGRHHTVSALLRFISEDAVLAARFRGIDPDPEAIMPGDLLVLQEPDSRGAAHHLAFALSGHHFCQCLRPYGVTFSSRDDCAFARSLKRVFRLYAEPPHQRDRLHSSPVRLVPQVRPLPSR